MSHDDDADRHEITGELDQLIIRSRRKIGHAVAAMVAAGLIAVAIIAAAGGLIHESRVRADADAARIEARDETARDFERRLTLADLCSLGAFLRIAPDDRTDAAYQMAANECFAQYGIRSEAPQIPNADPAGGDGGD